MDQKLLFFYIQDSYAILNSSLDKLGKDFEVDIVKGKFPYKYARKENFLYKGDTPNISYYTNITEKDSEGFKSTSWYFKKESVNHLKDDLHSLYKILCKVNKQTFLDYDIDMLNSLTISGLALKIFLSKL